MSVDQKEVQLEQALRSVLVAADQLGLDSEVLRLMAIGGLTNEVPAHWVMPEHVPGAIVMLNKVARSFSSAGEGAGGQRYRFW